MIIPAAPGTTAVVISHVDDPTITCAEQVRSVEVPVIAWVVPDNCEPHQYPEPAMMVLPVAHVREAQEWFLRLPDGRLLQMDEPADAIGGVKSLGEWKRTFFEFICEDRETMRGAPANGDA